MAIIKCKMCGGDMEISADKTYGTCEYCGSQMTLPKIDDDQRAAAFNRGNHFRRIGEFDKALATYEQIVREDDTDAEAHWCCALCRFGIEYVEDPATMEYVPTCHRASFDSFLEDVDYLAAVEHSEGVTRKQYQREGLKINEVQRGILATSQNEEPFDVFICYKESDENGERTVDSTLAQDIYYQLTEQGYRVFFARITLEDKVGAEYEPYIFAALHSAKVMVAVGTKPEYFGAVWVKNEWSRFISLMKKDRSKLLLPCYRDMDPYELPEQLSVLQSYDMSKIGFIQDLLRGVGKIVHTNDSQTAVVHQVVIGGSAEVAPLLKRAFMFLEDGDWSSADEYCEKVLDMAPECAEAYLGKLMAELRCSRQAALKDQAEPFENSNNYEKIIRFADANLKTELTDCIQHIYDRNEHTRLDGIYQRAQSAMDNAKTEADFKHAAGLFQTIPQYKDSTARAEKGLELAEIARKDSIYDSAKAKMTGEQIPSYENAIQMMQMISGWKDADQQIVASRNRIREIRKEEEQRRLEEERQAELLRQEEEWQEKLLRKEKEKRKKTIKKAAMIMTSIICACIVFVIVLQTVVIPSQKLNKANTLLESGDYISAYRLLDGLNYKDSEEKLQDILKTNSEDAMLQLLSSQIGSEVSWGVYEQDNNISNGRENIEWQVLDKQDRKILIISKYALDGKRYGTKFGELTWENCSLRQWLNKDFINIAFTAEEQGVIPVVTVSADENPDYPTDPGNATQDQIFLLSILEVNKYFPSDDAKECKPTPSAVANNTYELNTCQWWLRSPGDRKGSATFVSFYGIVDKAGDFALRDGCAVRPALWIDLDKLTLDVQA